MSKERFKQYRQYGGYKTIKELMAMSDPHDIKNYLSIFKSFHC